VRLTKSVTGSGRSSGRGQARLVREARRGGLTGCGGQHSSNTSPGPGGSNTQITRTKRHSPAHVGTPAKMASQAPEKRKVDSSILSLTTQTEFQSLALLPAETHDKRVLR